MRTFEKAVVILLVLLLVFLSLVPTADPKLTALDETLSPPSREHPLGTDPLGRDVLALMKAGLLRTLIVVVVGSALSLSLGLFFGLLAGYREGMTEGWIRSLADLTLIIPSFIIALIITALVGLSPVTAGLILGLLDMGNYIHQVTALTKEQKEEEYILALEKMGVKKDAILFRHICPNLLPYVLTGFGNRASGLILSYAGLAFIGLGTDVTQPDWGTMLYQYRIYIFQKPSLVFWPTFGIFTITMLFHLAFDRGEERRRG